ncbi:MAG: CoA-binding protein [Acidimicrobiales bacterium]
MPEVDELIDRILSTYPTIIVVGASDDPEKDAHLVPAHMQRHGWRIVPVNPRGGTILGEPAHRTLADAPEPVGLVNVFRPSAETPEVARQAVAAGATALWLQLGIASAEAREIAAAGGVLYVEDRCMLIEQRRRSIEAPLI